MDSHHHHEEDATVCIKVGLFFIGVLAALVVIALF